MSWWQSQFDKLLICGLLMALCGLALLVNGKLEAFAIQACGNLVGCLLTLVTVRRNPPPNSPPSDSN
jgi:hypothetical protein